MDRESHVDIYINASRNILIWIYNIFKEVQYLYFCEKGYLGIIVAQFLVMKLRQFKYFFNIQFKHFFNKIRYKYVFRNIRDLLYVSL